MFFNLLLLELGIRGGQKSECEVQILQTFIWELYTIVDIIWLIYIIDIYTHDEIFYMEYLYGFSSLISNVSFYLSCIEGYKRYRYGLGRETSTTETGSGEGVKRLKEEKRW